MSTTIASVGGRPTVKEDIAPCAVLLFLYIVGAIAHQTIHQRNRRKHHKFYMSWAMFGFCMARVGTCVLRIAWATRPRNARLAVAAGIFTNIGVLVLYLVLLLIAQRMFRATHPKLGWNRPLGQVLQVAYGLLLVALLLSIAFTVLSFYTLNPTLRSAALWIQKGAIIYMMVFNVTTLVLLLLCVLLPRAPDHENFGTGSMRAKMINLGVAIFFTIFIAGFRTGTAWSSPRLATNPGWYQTKAAFYVIIFGFEIIVIYQFIFTRFDQMFWVPNGSSKPGDYSQADLDVSTEPKESEKGPESVQGWPEPEQETSPARDGEKVHQQAEEKVQEKAQEEV